TLCAAPDIDHRAIATLHLGIHPAQNQNTAIELDHFTILRAARGIFSRSNVGLSARRAFQTQFGRCRLIREMHHDATSRTKRDDVRLLAASDRSLFGP